MIQILSGAQLLPAGNRVLDQCFINIFLFDQTIEIL